MKRWPPTPHPVVIGALILLAAAPGVTPPLRAQDFEAVSAARQRHGEDALSVDVEFAVGDFHLGAGSEATLYRMKLRYDADHFDPVSRYDAGSHRLRVGVDARRGGDFNYRHQESQSLDVSISPAVPTSFDFAVGAGTADIDLGGLSVRDVTFKGGASQATIRFSKPNRIACDRLSMEVGAIELHTEQLGNARCRRISLKGAAGQVTLDLTGDWTRGDRTDVDIAVGLGSVTVRVPERVGVSVDADRVLTSFDRSGLQRRGSSYYSTNYDSAATKVHLGIKAAMGDVNFEWVK